MPACPARLCSTSLSSALKDTGTMNRQEIKRAGSSLPVSSQLPVGARPWPQGSLGMDPGRARPTKAFPHPARLPETLLGAGG